MKVILDANVYISYLLAPAGHRRVVEVMEACLTDSDMELVVPEELMAELRASVQNKAYLQVHIAPEDLADLLDALAKVATLAPALPPTHSYVRDPKDDYPLAHGLVEEADYMVTGDDDLLVLGQIEGLQIVSVPRFWAVLFDSSS